MATTSWLRCLVLDSGDKQRTMLQTPPTTTRSHDASTTTTLPDDILVEIFSRLPAKSVGRFRSLSRSWSATLASGPFVDLHLHQANHRPIPKLFSTAAHLDDPDSNRWPFRVLTRPCGGLVLLRRQPRNSSHYVCNPSTGQLLRLPDTEGMQGGAAHNGHYVSYGLGYSPTTMEYKVVRFVLVAATPRCEVFTLDASAHWRAAAQKPPSGLGAVDAVRSPAVFFDGHLHFLLRQQGGTRIVTFDVVDETLSGSLPVTPAAQDGVVELAVLDGSLCLFVVRYGRPGSDVEPCCIWRVDAGRWEELYRLRQPRTTKRPELLLDLTRLRLVSSLEIYSSGNGQKKIILATEERVMAFHIHAGGGAPKKICAYSETRSGTVGLLEESLVPVGRTSEEIIYSTPWRKAWSDVLRWMPTRPLLALTCVCKEWRAVINSDRFMRTHALHANLLGGKSPHERIKLLAHPHLFSNVSYHPLESVSERVQQHEMMPFLLHHGSSRIVCSKPCHGLLLLSYIYTRVEGSSTIHYLCNPSRECSSLVFLDHEYGVERDSSIGLGYDLRTNKHALVHIACHKKGSGDYQLECYVQLACTTSSSWISIGAPPRPVADMHPVYAHGKLYWMVDDTLGTTLSDARFELLALDVGTREFEVLPGPRCSHDGITSIVEFQGNIYILCSDRRANAIDVWTLEGGSWSVGCHIDLGESKRQMYSSDETTLLDVDPKDGRILLSTGRALGYYDPKTRALQTIYYLGEHLHGMKFAPALCQESLIGPRT